MDMKCYLNWTTIMIALIKQTAGSRVSFGAIVGMIPERDAGIFNTVAIRGGRVNALDSDSNLNDYWNPVERNSMRDVIKNTIAYARGEKTEPIKAEMFWGMLHFAQAMDIEESWGKQLLINVIKYGLLNKRYRRSIATYAFKIDKYSQKYISIKLFFEFLHMFGIYFRVAVDGGREDLLIGCNHPHLLHECRDMWKYPEIENNPNSTFYRAFKNVIMHCSPFLIHDADRNVKMTLLTLIGMIPGGRHVIAADCEEWTGKDGFEEVIDTIQLKDGELAGISGLHQNHMLITDGCLWRYAGRSNDPIARRLDYLDVAFKYNGDQLEYEQLLTLMLYISPARMCIRVDAEAHPYMGEILDASRYSVVEDLNIVGIDKFCDIYDKFSNEMLRISTEKNIRSLSCSDHMIESYNAGRDIECFKAVFGMKLKYVYTICPPIHERNEEKADAEYVNTVLLAESIKTSLVETLVFRHPHSENLPLRDEVGIFTTLLEARYLKTLILAYEFETANNNVLWTAIRDIETAIRDVGNLGNKKIIIAVETPCNLPILCGRVARVSACRYNMYYELYPNKDERLENKRLKIGMRRTCGSEMRARRSVS